MKLPRVFGFILGLILFVSLTACDDDPASLGVDLLPGSDFLNLVHADSRQLNLPQNVSVFTDSISTGSSSRILLGKFENLEAWMLIKFNFVLPDSITNALKNGEITILNSWIELQPNYILGDSVFNNFTFEVRRINARWNPNTFTADSLITLDYDNTNLARNFSYSDTTIRFDFSNDVVSGWLKRQVDDTQPDDNGILFVPLTGNMVLGFQALTFKPEDPQPVLKIVLEKQGEFTDTISATPTSDLHVIKGNQPQSIPGSFILQDGLPLRAKYRIDLSTLPQNSAVNKARLTFFINKEATVQGSVPSDSLELYIYSDSLKNSVERRYGRVVLKRQADAYSGDVTSFIQRWLNGLDNQGMRINLTDEARALSKIVLYSPSAADTDKKPLLEIDYLIKK